MGLSNQERKMGLFNNIASMMRIERLLVVNPSDAYLESRHIVKEIKESVKRLWHHALNQEDNLSLLWFSGNADFNEINQPDGVWGTAIYCQLSSDIYGDDPYPEGDCGDWPRSEFNVHDLLANKEKRDLLRLHRCCESVNYYLRRYDDDFFRKYSDLMKEIFTIQGLLFEMFRKDVDYARAYVANRFCDRVLFDKHKDSLGHILLNACLNYNDLHTAFMTIKLRDLIEIDRRFETGKFSNTKRIVAVLEILGRRCHSTYHYIKLKAKLEENNISYKKKEILKQLAINKKLHEEYERSKKEPKIKVQSEASYLIHGFIPQED